jgi:DUF4097 and DUF4098 domain-containing protein YvlB
MVETSREKAIMLTRTIPAVLAFCFIAVPLTASDRKGYPMDVNAGGVQKIVFDVQEGNFALRGSPQAKEIHMIISIDRMWIFKLGEQDILKRLIKISGEGTPEVTIRTDIPRGILSFGRAEYPIDFEVVVPDRAKLEIQDTSGNIAIRDMNGHVTVHDGSGTVALRNLNGGVSLQKESGDVKISDIRDAARIESKTGQMDIRRTGALDIRDADGNLTISDAASARVRSRGGNLHISNVKGDLEVDDESGEIILSRIGGKVDVRDTSGQIRAMDTGPLSIRDTSGDITVRRASSLDVIAKESGQIAVGGILGPVNVPPGFKIKKLK